MVHTGSFRLAAIGDGLVGPLVHAGRGESGHERLFIDNRFINWLRVILPGAEVAEDAVFGGPGESTVSVARCVQRVLELDPLPQAVLICVGTEDCLATIRGIAPAPDETVAALEAAATEFVAASVKPIFIIPPPCALFSNGLFADRFVAVAATLRRMSRQDTRIGLIDPTDILMKQSAFGIEPEARYVAASTAGRLSSLGAFRLAEQVARQLPSMLTKNSIRRRPNRQALDALNDNPFLNGSRGMMQTDAASGHCATGYCINAHQLGGARIRAKTDVVRQGDVAQRLIFSGRYTTNWGFVWLCQNVDAETLDDLAAGDVIEAVCDFELAGPVMNIAAVSLHATAVWDTDFIGLHSSKYVGGPGVSEPHSGLLRTPQFTIPGKLKKLHVSLQAHLVPGTDLDVGGQLEVRSIVLRKVKRESVTTRAIDSRQHGVLVEARRQA